MGYCIHCGRLTMDAGSPIHIGHNVVLIDYDKLMAVVKENLDKLKRE